MSTKIKKNQQSKPLKKIYSSPKLIHFGTISELTSAGSGTMQEGMDVKNTMKFN